MTSTPPSSRQALQHLQSDAGRERGQAVAHVQGDHKAHIQLNYKYKYLKGESEQG
jgi:hypothetical protein